MIFPFSEGLKDLCGIILNISGVTAYKQPTKLINVNDTYIKTVATNYFSFIQNF